MTAHTFQSNTVNETRLQKREFPNRQWLRDDSIELVRSRLNSNRSLSPMIIGVTSCDRKSGTTNIATRLAVCEAQSGNNTLLISSNNRTLIPRHHALDQATNSERLEWLRDNIAPTKVPSLHRLQLNVNSVSSVYNLPFTFDAFRDSIANDYATIICDLPKIENSIRALSLAGICKGVIMVVDGRTTRAADASSTLKILKENEIKVLGAILNRARPLLPAFLRKWF